MVRDAMRSPDESGTVLAMGSTGRVARLLQAAWAHLGETRIAWQARRADTLTSAAVVDPLTKPDALSDLIPQNGIVFALCGVTPSGSGDLSENLSLALAAYQAAEAAGARHVFCVSSAAVYGNQSGRLSEAVPLSPASDYGRAKQGMEQALIQRNSTQIGAGPGLTILRLGNLAGADQLLGSEKSEAVLDRFSDGTGPLRSYIGPMTLASVLSALFDKVSENAELPTVLNIAQPGAIGMDALLKAAGRRWVDRPAPASAIPKVELDVSRLAHLVGPMLKPATAEAIVKELQLVRSLQA